MHLSPRRQPFTRKPLDHSVHFTGRFGATYFLTVCCNERGKNQLCHQNVARELFRSAALYDQRQIWYLVLLLLMPDHCHALVSIDADASLSVLIKNFKRVAVKFAGVQWQRNFFDHRLRSDESIEEKAVYIRQNPVRAALVRRQEEWPFVLDRTTLGGWRFGEPPLPCRE